MASRTTPPRKTQAGDGDAAARVLRRFRVVFNAVKSHFRAVESNAGISGAQLWALSVVHKQPGVRVGELARAMDVHQSTASNLLKALQEAGLVISDRTGDDKRFVQLTVTPKGLRALSNAPGPFTGLLPEALARLDERTLARLEHDLDQLAGELHTSPRGARIPLGAGKMGDERPASAPGPAVRARARR